MNNAPSTTGTKTDYNFDEQDECGCKNEYECTEDEAQLLERGFVDSNE